jgi:N-acyl-phosphatidylethanolamine-hydrolysing phospholipase D
MTDLPSRPSHHAPDGRFRNPWPEAEPRSFGDVLRWGLARLARRLRGEGRDRSRFEIASPSYASPRAPADALTITWVGHSTALVQMGGANVLTDPMWSRRASPLRWMGPARRVPPAIPLDALPPIDLVLVSHNHYDHLDDATVRRLAARHPHASWMAPLGLATWLRRRGARAVTELDWWDAAHVASAAGPLSVTATPAQHFSARGLRDRMRTLWCGFAIAAGAHRVLFCGDTGNHPEWRAVGARLGPFHAVLAPVGAYEPRWFMRPVHMDPDEAVAALRALDEGARAHDAPAHDAPAHRRPVMVPIHWGTFPLTDEPLDEPPARTRDAWRRAALPDEELWLLRHGETKVLGEC